jgi:hypothetical protein
MRRCRAVASLALALAILAGCMSIPLSTVMKLSRFGEKDFVALDPREVRVRVAVPDGYAWDAEGAKLETAIDVGTKMRTDRFQLTRVSQERGTRSVGMFSKDTPVSVATLRLSDASVQSFRDLQRFIAARPAKDVSLNVSISMLGAPKGATSVKVWIDLMLSAQSGYFVLVDGGTVRLNSKAAY